MRNPFIRNLAACLAIGLLLAVQPAAGHGTHLPRPSKEELAKIQPPIPGGEAFARAVFEHLSHGLDGARKEIVERIGQMLFYQDQIAGGFSPQSGPRDAEYFRWQMDRALMELVDGFPGLVEMDFRSGSPAWDKDKPVELDPQTNLVIVKTLTGDGAPGFSVQDIDLLCEQAPDIVWPEGNNKRLIRIRPNAVTYSLLRLHQVPQGKTILHVAFQNDDTDKPHHWHALTLTTPENGQFALDLLDETGAATPAMVRLTTKLGKRLHEPAGAIDLRPLMNEVTGLTIYGPGRGYKVPMPGKFAGHYWYLPHGFEMALPAGEWELHVFRGLEYVPVLRSFTVKPGGHTKETVKLERHTDMPARGWFSGDDHTHARLMSSEDGEKLLTVAKAADLHVCNVLEMGDWMRSFYPQRGFGKEYRVGSGRHWIVPGIEDPRSLLGHAIGLNLTSRVRDLSRYLLNDWWAGEIHKQGGLYGHTHVGQKACLVEREMAIFQPMGIVDFNSILQTTLGTEYYFDFLNMGFKMTATSGEDMPYMGVTGGSRFYAYCGTEKPFDPDLWFAAVKRGNTFVTNGPLLDLRVEQAMPGDEIPVKENRKLKVTAKAWGIAGQTAPEVLRLVKLGETAAEEFATNEAQSEIEITTELDAGHGFWLVAYAKGRDGSEAITTPVYVVREGLRFWNVDKAEAVIERQLAVIDETEVELRKCEEAARGGAVPLDYWVRWGAEQADEVRVRMNKARDFYHHLKEQLAHERKLRAKP